jgi:hypothetical protein
MTKIRFFLQFLSLALMLGIPGLKILELSSAFAQNCACDNRCAELVACQAGTTQLCSDYSNTSQGLCQGTTQTTYYMGYFECINSSGSGHDCLTKLDANNNPLFYKCYVVYSCIWNTDCTCTVDSTSNTQRTYYAPQYYDQGCPSP